MELTVSYRAYCSLTWNSTQEFVQQIVASPAQKRSSYENKRDNDMLLDDSRIETMSGAIGGDKVERDLTVANNWMMSMEEKINAILNENRRKRSTKNTSLEMLFGLEDNSLLGFVHLDPRKTYQHKLIEYNPFNY